MKISIVYVSQTGTTETAAEFIQDGILAKFPFMEIKLMNIHEDELDVDFPGSKCRCHFWQSCIFFKHELGIKEVVRSQYPPGGYQQPPDRHGFPLRGGACPGEPAPEGAEEGTENADRVQPVWMGQTYILPADKALHDKMKRKEKK